MPVNKDNKMTGYASIDKPWLKYYSKDAINAEFPKCSIYENIYKANKEYDNEIALIYYGKKITYKKLFCKVDKVSKSLISYGVRCGDNVGICMPAMPETIYLILALNKIGANANMLNLTFAEEELITLINSTETKLLFIVSEAFNQLKNVISKSNCTDIIAVSAVNSLNIFTKVIKRVKKIQNAITWDDFIKNGKHNFFETPVYVPNRPAIMVYSSGTTGASKGIQLTNDSVNATITEGMYIGFKWNRQDRCIAVVPIWFSTGICAQILMPLHHGITVILEPLYDFKIFYQHIEAWHPNFTITAIGLADYLMNEKEMNDAYKYFKYFVIGGEYITSVMENKLNQWLRKNGSIEKIHKGYGMCELGGTVTATHYKCNEIGSAGIPTPHVIVAAFDLDTGKELKYRERGEIRVLSPCKMLGYYKKKEETEKFFHTDLSGRVWCCTGDMGYVTEDGCLYVDGRIESSYKNEEGDIIYLFDIERAILNIEQVRQCRVVVSKVNGVNIHVAHIVLTDAADRISVLSNIKEYCSNNLQKNHMPTLLKLYNSALPVSKAGKVDIIKMQNDVVDLVRL